MAWTYLIINIFDFLVAPILFMGFWKYGTVWTPLTLQGGGMFHLSMGAIVGFHVWGRTQEKIKSELFDFESVETRGPPIPHTINVNKKEKEKEKDDDDQKVIAE